MSTAFQRYSSCNVKRSCRAYNVLVKFGTTTLPLIIDSGSADVWALSDSCSKQCTAGLPTYPHKRLNYSGVDARIFYGDSSSTSYFTPHLRHPNLMFIPQPAPLLLVLLVGTQSK